MPADLLSAPDWTALQALGWWVPLAVLGPSLVTGLGMALVTQAMLRARSRAFGRERARWRALTEDLRNRFHGRAEDLAAAQAGMTLRDQRLAEMMDEVDALRDDRDAARRDLAALSATLEQERQAAQEKLTLLRDTGEAMTARFKALADEALLDHGEALERRHREHLDTLLKPFRDQIEAFQGRVNAVHTESQRATGALDAQLKSLVDLNHSIGREASGLARVLRGGGRAQGAWGELVLERILEQSGLRRGHDFETQVTAETPQGRRRPDVIVHLPQGRAIIIDSKVSLTAFDRHCAVTDGQSDAETARATALKEHLRSLRGHIDDLGRKDYYKLVGDGLDVVLMFVPVEGALALALGADTGLIDRALERRVILCGPTTLTLALRTVAHLWRMDQRSQGTAKLAQEAEALYDRFAAFAEDMIRVGTALETAQAAHDAALGKLSRGRGNVVARLERLRTESGLAPTRTIPTPLIEGTGTTPAEAGSQDQRAANPPAPEARAGASAPTPASASVIPVGPSSCRPARVGLA